MILCKNCGAEVPGKYCGECGQKASTKRFDTNIVFSELFEKLLPFDKGVLFTSIRLMVAPGESMRGYLAGKRADYTKPLAYTLLVIALSLIFFSPEDFKQGMQDGLGGGASEKAKAAQIKIAEIFTGNLSLIYSLLIPFLALTSKWFYRKQGLNYAEYLVICAYYSSGSILCGMPLMVAVSYFKKSHYSTLLFGITAVIYLGYFVWAYVRFFKNEKPWGIAWRAIGTYLLACLLYILFVSLLTVTALIIYEENKGHL